MLICGAGLAAALPGVVAAHTELPVIGVPLRSSMSVLDGLDALLSIVADAAGRAGRDGRCRQREERRACSPRGSSALRVAPEGPPGPLARPVVGDRPLLPARDERIWSEEGRLARWLEVELAALDGWAELGTIPAADVAAIRAAAKPPTPERVAEIERVTDHDLAAFVDAVAEQLGPEGRWVHYGLTSSDVVDTALSLQIQDAGKLLLAELDRALDAVVRRAEQHRDSICIGRSHGIHAEPTTFGWKLAGWAFELDRDRTRLARALESNRVGQLSGTVGTYAAIDPEVERIACERLGLEPIRSRRR